MEEYGEKILCVISGNEIQLCDIHSILFLIIWKTILLYKVMHLLY